MRTLRIEDDEFDLLNEILKEQKEFIEQDIKEIETKLTHRTEAQKWKTVNDLKDGLNRINILLNKFEEELK